MVEELAAAGHESEQALARLVGCAVLVSVNLREFLEGRNLGFVAFGDGGFEKRGGNPYAVVRGVKISTGFWQLR